MVEAARVDRCGVWGSHLFFDDDRALLGLGGWKGEPIDELDYAVAPARQGRGAR